MAKEIEDSISFAAKRQVWQQMIERIICAMLIAMNIWQNSIAVLLSSIAVLLSSIAVLLSSIAVLLSSKAARRNALWRFAII